MDATPEEEVGSLMVQIRRSRKQRTEAAIAFALARRWDEAAAENRALLDEFPDDIEAANRLGKALTELGDFDGAAEAYQRTLAMDGTNVIAKRNLARIEELRSQAPKGKRAAAGAKKGPKAATQAPTITPAAVRPHSLIEESGRSAEFTLQNPDLEALRQMSAGDPADVVATAQGASIRSAAGTVLGHLEPRAGLRLRRLMQGGNRYAVVIRRITDGEATIYIRETFRAPEQKDEPSFLPSAAAARRRLAPRAYTKPISRYPGDGMDDGEDGDDSWTPRGTSNSSDDEMDEAGFGDANMSDDDDIDGLASDDDDEPMSDDDEDDL